MAEPRILTAATSEAALYAALRCRAPAIQVLAEAPIGSPCYRRAAELLGAIDALAEALTGKPDLFHTKAHTAGG